MAAPAPESASAPAHHATHHAADYNSNPFRSTMAQLAMVIKNNPISSLTLGVILLGVVLGAYVVGFILTLILHNDAGVALVALAEVIFLILFVFRFSAAILVLHKASHDGQTMTGRQAIDAATKTNYSKYVLASLAVLVIVVLGFIALVIPGIILMGRLSLAPIIALYEGLGVGESLKKSWKLTSGHWFEMVGAMFASSIVVSEGLLSLVGGQSGQVNRYYELSALQNSGAPKPKVHWMNYLIVIGVGVLLVAYFAAVAAASRVSTPNYGKDTCTNAYGNYGAFCSNTFNSDNNIKSLDNNSTPAN